MSIRLQLGSTTIYSDGTNPNSTAAEAVKVWNGYMGRLQLTHSSFAAGAGGQGNGQNEVFFSNKAYGYSFGENVLAVTMSRSIGGQRSESDIIFNQSETWDSYRGYLRQAADLRRVMVHEVGHLLGLDHPDEAGQYYDAVMNAYISWVETPQRDDQNGVGFIYGYGVANPPVGPTLDSYEPHDATVVAGETVWLSVSPGYDDTPPITYQWRKDDVNIPGATSATLVLETPALADSGFYDVVVSGPGGTVTSRKAKVTINPPSPPVISSYGPSDTSVTLTKIANFSVTLDSGTPPFTFQWHKDGVAIAGATMSYYSIPAVTQADEGLYSVVVSNVAGSATSRNARLTVTPPTLPTVTVHDSSRDAYVGRSFSLSLYPYDGTDPFTYAWEKNGVKVSGANSSTLNFTDIGFSDAGNYVLVVTNAAGTVRSDPITVRVLPIPRPPEAVIGTSYGTPFRLEVNSGYDSFGPYTYQWYRNGQLLSGATGTFYDIPAADRYVPADFVVVVTNASGNTASKARSYAPPTGSATPAVGGWIAVEQHGDVVYFLFANPARVERYDLAQQKWLSTISLSQTPTAFRPDDSGLYVAFGKSVSWFNQDGTGETAVAAADQNIRDLFVRDGVLYLFHPDSYVYSKFTSIRLSDKVTLSTHSLTYGMTKGGSLSIAPNLGFIFGRDSGLSPSDIRSIVLNADGTFGEQRDSLYHGDYPVGDRSFVAPDETLVIEDCGTVYNASDLTFAGMIAPAFDDLSFAANDTIVVLRGAMITIYDAAFQETGRVALDSPGSRLFVRGQTASVFSPPPSSGMSTTVTHVDLSTASTRAALPKVEPSTLSYTPSEIILGSDNIVYLLSRAHANVFRWAIDEGRYLESVSFTGAPNILTYDANSDALFAAYHDRRITRVGLDTGNQEKPFAIMASDVLGLAMAGDYLFVNDQTSPWTSFYTFASDGSIIARKAWSELSQLFVWSEPKNRVYHLRDYSGLRYTEINTDGTFGNTGQSNSASNRQRTLSISPNGGTILLSDGVFYDSDTLQQNNALPVTVDDAAWLGSRVYTARPSADGTLLERWGGNNYGRDAEALLSGTVLRLLALRDERLLCVLMRAGAPAFVILDANLDTAPQIAAQPEPQTVRPGVTATFSATIGAGANLSYQWNKDGVAIEGATDATLVLSDVESADAGAYSVTVTNTFGSVTSEPATLTVGNSRLVAISTRSRAGSGDQTLIMGFVVAGGGEKQLVVRGVGPTLVPLGVTEALPDPSLYLYGSAGAMLDHNDNWGGSTEMLQTFARLGMSPVLAADSKDAALLRTISTGAYTAHVTATTTSNGIALVEVYDGDAEASSRFTALATRTVAGNGENTLIAGIVLAGNAPKKLLIRGVGPSLVSQGVSAASVLLDPQLAVFSGGTMIAQNDNWAGAEELKSAFSKVGLGGFDSDLSKDAALMVTLEPGVYTVHVSGVNDTSGVALIEVYEMP